MIAPSRRTVLSALAACGCAAASPARAWRIAPVVQTIAQRGGCALRSGELAQIEASAGAGVSFGRDAMLPTSGDAALDRALGAALVRLSQVFGERPGFAFYDDSDSPNAFATSDTRVPGTWGTVLFGKTIFWKLVRDNGDQGISVLAVVAHEFSHVVQFHHGLDEKILAGQRTNKRLELHADYLSGYYLGVRKRDNPSISLLAAGAEFRALGDLHFASVDHHGTPDERIAAAELGFKLGFGGEPLARAVDEGTRYVLTL